MALGLPRSVKSHPHLNRNPATRSHFSYVITSARCVTGQHQNRQGHSPPQRRLPDRPGAATCVAGLGPAAEAGPSLRRAAPRRAGPGRQAAGRPARGKVKGSSREEVAGGADRASALGTCSPSPACRRAGAEPSPTRWGPVSHFPRRSGPRPARPRPPTVGAPSLLELLDLLQAQPRALVDAEVSQHLLHGLCVRVLHCCGGPAGLASCPRGLLASTSHSDRGLVPPRAPRRGLASLPPPPPPTASASRGAESPRTPPAGDRPFGCPAAPAPASGSAGRRGPCGPPSPAQKRGPPSPSTARPESRPPPPSPLPALLRRFEAPPGPEEGAPGRPLRAEPTEGSEPMGW